MHAGYDKYVQNYCRKTRKNASRDFRESGSQEKYRVQLLWNRVQRRHRVTKMANLLVA
jgi:hypothetical protein